MGTDAVAEQVTFGAEQADAWNAALDARLQIGKLYELVTPINPIALANEVRGVLYQRLYNNVYGLASRIYDAAQFLASPWWSWDDNPDLVIVDPERKKVLRSGVTSDENAQYRGRLAARLQQAMKLRAGYDLTTGDLDNIGQTVATAMRRQGAWRFDFTDTINWNAGDFGDSGSCYWRSNAGAKDVLEYQDNDFRAMRFYDESGRRAYGTGIGVGRCWIVIRNQTIKLDPLGLVKATLRVPCVFNGYWDQNFYDGRRAYFDASDVTNAASHVLATHIGGVTQRIELTNTGETSGKVYVNGGTYAVYPQAVHAAKLALPRQINMRLAAPPPNARCQQCRTRLNADNRVQPNAGRLEWYCKACFTANFVPCDGCNGMLHTGRDQTVVHNGARYCYTCYQRLYGECIHCHRIYEKTQMRSAAADAGDRRMVCNRCYEQNTATCACCKQNVYSGLLRATYDLQQLRLEQDRQRPRKVCDSCSTRYTRCGFCNKYVTPDAVLHISGATMCLNCRQGREPANEQRLLRCDNCGVGFMPHTNGFGQTGMLTNVAALCRGCHNATVPTPREVFYA